MVGSLLGFYYVILLAIIGVRFIIYLNNSYFKTCLPRSVKRYSANLGYKELFSL